MCKKNLCGIRGGTLGPGMADVASEGRGGGGGGGKLSKGSFTKKKQKTDNKQLTLKENDHWPASADQASVQYKATEM